MSKISKKLYITFSECDGISASSTLGMTFEYLEITLNSQAETMSSRAYSFFWFADTDPEQLLSYYSLTDNFTS